jgi:hypothetical protein
VMEISNDFYLKTVKFSYLSRINALTDIIISKTMSSPFLPLPSTTSEIYSKDYNQEDPEDYSDM